MSKTLAAGDSLELMAQEIIGDLMAPKTQPPGALHYYLMQFLNNIRIALCLPPTREL